MINQLSLYYYYIAYEISERYNRFVLHSMIRKYVYEMIIAYYFQKMAVEKCMTFL